MMNVTAYGHLDAAGEGLEDTFYLVVLIGSLGLDMEVHTGRITQRLEEMEEHLGRHGTSGLFLYHLSILS